MFLARVNARMRAEPPERFRLLPVAMAARLARLLFDGIATHPNPTRQSHA